MESPVLTLVVALFFAVNVESQPAVIPPPSLLPEIPPQRQSPLTPPPSTPRPLPDTPTQPLPRPLSQPPSPRLPLPPPPPRKHLQPAIPKHGNYNSNKNLSPPRGRAKPNMGKKIGLMFIGVAAVLQLCILAFLLISRRQLLKSEQVY